MLIRGTIVLPHLLLSEYNDLQRSIQCLFVIIKSSNIQYFSRLLNSELVYTKGNIPFIQWLNTYFN